MSNYGFIGTFKSVPGKRDALIAILLQAAEAMTGIKSCRHYLVSKDTTDENTVIVTEVWDSKEDHDNALKANDSAALIAQAIPLMDGKPQGKAMEVLGGKGIQRS
jgi:quinol monooxygenase YgiN